MPPENTPPAPMPTGDAYAPQAHQATEAEFASPENAVNLLAALAAAPSHTLITPNASDTALPLPSTPSEESKGKRKRKTSPPLDLSDPNAEIERIHPDLPGPVFIHPSASATQACVRCHKVKRKCEGNAKYKCRGCVKNEDDCVFELNPGASTLVRALKERNIRLEEELSLAMNHIQALELLVSQLNPDGAAAANSGI